jgi:predicted dehydrogenase
MGQIYARWFSRNKNTVPASFYNRTFLKAEELAYEYNAEACTNWEEIVRNPEIDIIGICTPSSGHKTQLLECIANKKHVLIEKPFAATAAEAKEMADAALAPDAKVKVMVGFQMRFHPVIEKVNELLKNTGKIYNVDFYFGMYRPEVTWRHKLDQGGGVLKELGSHLLDLSCMWLGDFTNISAVNRTFGAGREVEDFSQTVIEFQNGSFAGISCNYWDRRDRVIHGRIIAEKAQINFGFSPYEVSDSRITLFDQDGGHEVNINIPPEPDIDKAYPGHLDSFKKEIDFFVDSVVNDKDLTWSVKAGLRSMAITNAAYRSQMLNSAIKNSDDLYKIELERYFKIN